MFRQIFFSLAIFSFFIPFPLEARDIDLEEMNKYVSSVKRKKIKGHNDKTFHQQSAKNKFNFEGYGIKSSRSEASFFSKSSTQVDFENNFILGGNSYSGTKFGDGDADTFQRELGKIQFYYDYAINIYTTFDGNDLLKATLKTGSLADQSPFSGESRLGGLEIPNNELFVSFTSGSRLELERLFYTLPIGESNSFFVGGQIRQDDILAAKTTKYNGEILDFFTYSGSPAAYHGLNSSGVGWAYEKQGYSLSASYISENNTMMTEESVGSTSIQLGYDNSNWWIAAVYNYTQGAVPIEAGTDEVNDRTDDEDDNYASYALSAFWDPSDKKNNSFF